MWSEFDKSTKIVLVEPAACSKNSLGRQNSGSLNPLPLLRPFVIHPKNEISGVRFSD